MQNCMEDQIEIMNTIVNIFNGSDRRNWNMVRECFHFEVFLDYFSLSKIPGSKVRSDEVIEGWTEFLSRFVITHHMVSNFEVELNGSLAKAFCKGQAFHYAPCPTGDTWTIYGNYDFTLSKIASTWKVTSLIFNLLYEGGNKELPAMMLTNKKDVE